MKELPELPDPLAKALVRAASKDQEVTEELDELEAHLRSEGLAEVADEIENLRESAVPAGLFGRVSESLRSVAQRQWKLFTQELGESRELLSLLTKRVRGEIKQFSPEEEEAVKRQVADLFRAVPATAMALAPVPGAALITPFVLQKLGLLPSAWRHAHLLARLERAALVLEREGDAEQAARVRATATRLAEHAADREDRIRTLRKHPQLRVLYDFNEDGVLDDEEWAAIKEDRARLVEVVRDQRDDCAWHFSGAGDVQGPVPLTELLECSPPEHSLVYAPTLERWLPVAMVYEALSGD